MLRCLNLAVLSLCTLLALPTYAADDLDIAAELSRPGVRLVAVEFFSKDCEPCKRAAPRWKALHEKYRDRGLRFVVVALDDSGRCPNLGWAPDKEFCDVTGSVSERFGVTGLPAAFLWSWRGALLVSNGAHVDAVEQAVEKELAALPRVMLAQEVVPALAKQAAGLDGLVRAELAKSRKVQVLASDRDQHDLEALRKKSHAADVDERCQIKLGQVLPANAKLTVRLTQGGTGDWLFLEMHDAEKGCDLASGKARWHTGQADVAVTEAVADLLQALRAEVQLPGGPRTRAEVKKPFGGTTVEQGKDVETEDLDEAVVKFTATPPAAVFLGDKMLCKQTPCQKAVALGKQSVTMSAEDYVTRTESVAVAKDTREIKWQLAADFATLNVTCGGQTVNVKVDGEPTACPVVARRVRPGRHRVALDSPCHLGAEEAFVVQRGESKDVALAVHPRLGVVTVKAQNDAGDDLTGTAWLDGKALGDVPGSFKVPVCGKNLEVRSDGHASWAGELKVAEGEKARVMAELRVTELVKRTKPDAVAPASPSAARTREQVDAAIALGKGSFRDNGDGTVAQTDAGLAWQKADSGRDFNWHEAFQYCGGLSLQGGGWRLPAIEELVRTLDRSGPDDRRFDAAFENSAAYYWSASPVDGLSDHTWYVNYFNAVSSDAVVGYNGRVRVRCVRGEPKARQTATAGTRTPQHGESELQTATEVEKQGPALSQAQVDAVATRASRKVVRCYMLYADQDGREDAIKAQVTVHSDGSVVSSAVQGKHANDQVGRCISEAVKALQFPPSGGAPKKYTIRYAVGG